ncbi:hypothetical protein B0I35DRAFT_412028 [Stachybotrys elegans]|uniref:Uncharacterized protein n=1 Tax=Stachybotrys elegans TaxID=80388 RepID=A0A8K0SHS2_9HYPO|nr:hypothetical protein B0I35DRAFT_412028 [Stachybotrys elegans]
MDRDKDAPNGRPNGRPAAQLQVKQSGRKPLFAAPNASGRDNTATTTASKDQTKTRPTSRFRSSTGAPSNRRTSSESHAAPTPLGDRRGSTSSAASSSAGTRIPRPSSSSFSQRKPISLVEAYKLAEREEDADDDDDDASYHPADASPSPAPRAWRAKNEQEERRMRKALAHDHLDVKDRTRALRGQIEAATKAADAQKDGATEEKKSVNANAAVPGTGVSVTDDKKANTENGVALPGDRADKNRPLSGLFGRRTPSKESVPESIGLPPLVPGIEDLPLPSGDSIRQELPFALRPPFTYDINPSPEKSFAWQVDQDFTAGDLQVSDSPMIKVRNQPFADRLNFDESSNIDINSKNRVNPPGSRNTKLDEIRRSEVKQGFNPAERPRRNTRLAEILNRETAAERIPIPDRNLPRPANTKLDEIRQREMDGPSRRALAATRLEEIREKNATARSPDEVRPPRPLSDSGPTFIPEVEPPVRPKSAFETGGQRIPDTPVTVFKNRGRYGADTLDKPADKDGQDIDGGATRADSKDLLRRLARAASNSPSVETESHKLPTPPKEPAEKPTTTTTTTTTTLRPRNTARIDREKRNSTAENKEAEKRLTVGFAEFPGLRRVRSSESTRSKRSSLHSEPDPTDRIEAEMKLFAPMDNYSERGSVRAPSPPPDVKDEEENDDEVEATPRPKRQDPLTMPTPRVTGAYVETPATVKAEDRWNDKATVSKAEKRYSAPELPALRAKERASLRRKSSRDDDTASDPGTDEKKPTASALAPARKPRARSLPRRRPPLRNSAKPPSVKEDLLELQRSNNIEDSTLDEFEEKLSLRKNSLPPLGLDEDDDDDFLSDGKMAPQGENKRKMEQKRTQEEALRQALMAIREARSGIDRFQEQLDQQTGRDKGLVNGSTTDTTEKESVTSTETKATRVSTEKTLPKYPVKMQQEKPVAYVPATESSWTYVQLPVPRLYRRNPEFKLTLLGMLTLLLTLWLAMESSMCALFCRPETCSTATCAWSYDDPVFGQALPVKVDQWTTGGQGRRLLNAAIEEAWDWAADLEDSMRGQDLTDRDTESMTFVQLRQHRRRLYKKGFLDGLGQPRDAEEQRKWDSWRQTRLARERVRELREAGFSSGREDEEVLGGDQRVG